MQLAYPLPISEHAVHEDTTFTVAVPVTTATVKRQNYNLTAVKQVNLKKFKFSTRFSTMSTPLKPLELTLAILKPHVVKYPLAFEAIRNIILTSNFKIARSKRHAFSLKDAARFYEEHKGKFFYNRLVTFMTR